MQQLHSEARTERKAEMPQEEAPDREQGTAEERLETIHVYFVREEAEQQQDGQIRESTPPGRPQQQPGLLTSTTFLFGLFLPLTCLTWQLYLLFNPLVATVTLFPKSTTVTLTATLQLGRLVNPITISQSQTVPATGKSHQDARAATGSLTFYNGQFTNVTIAAGTILTGANGIQMITDQDATIPAANPPVFGHVTISAHAIHPGSKGNIAAYDVNEACCATSVLAKNTKDFTGGADEQDFSTVSQQDINRIAPTLKTSLAYSVSEAFQGQVLPTEQLFMLPCTPTATSDHQIGQEATHVKVTVSQTCSAVAYSSQALADTATASLSHQVLQKKGTGYSLMGNVHVTVKQSTVTHAPTPLVFLSFHAQGTWVYALTTSERERITSRIAGKTKQEAVHILESLPGVEQAAIRFSGFGDDTRLPKQSTYIHITLFVM